jgi:hypothetical protein
VHDTMARRLKRLAGLLLVALLAARCAGEPTPPITLKFIGIVEQGDEKRKIAVLSDGSATPVWR